MNTIAAALGKSESILPVFLANRSVRSVTIRNHSGKQEVIKPLTCVEPKGESDYENRKLATTIRNAP